MERLFGIFGGGPNNDVGWVGLDSNRLALAAGILVDWALTLSGGVVAGCDGGTSCCVGCCGVPTESGNIGTVSLPLVLLLLLGSTPALLEIEKKRIIIMTHMVELIIQYIVTFYSSMDIGCTHVNLTLVTHW